MPDAVQSHFTFLPWLRLGAVTAIATPDTLGTGLDARATFQVELELNQNVAQHPKATLRLYGPGDVTGIDAAQIIRHVPGKLATEFEPNYFPFIEFDRPDFPWMMTPAAANAEKLRPWICLVAAEKREGVTMKPGDPLWRLVIKKGAQAELPSLFDCWAWAHAQVTGPFDPDQAEALNREHPERTLSRLLCPRRLKARTSYYACVVPTFKVGVETGLGSPDGNLDTLLDDGSPKPVALEPAWHSGDDAVTLPVYYHWEFSTGDEGDFESLAARLTPRTLLSIGVGNRVATANGLGYDLPDVGDIRIEGALGIPSPRPALPDEFVKRLTTILNSPQVQLS